MHKVLAIKELRESAGVVALAGLGLAYALAELTATPLVPWQSRWLYSFPFVRDSLGFYVWLVCGGLAIALAFRQTAWELGQGTYYFLLHRPVSRRRVFAMKLVVGCTLTMFVAGVLIGLYALWAATPGRYEAPFFWEMTVPAWQQWAALPPIYFAAFLAGIRPGRWFGSRLVPLAAGILAAIAASNLPWFWAGVGLSAVASALLLVSIFYYVEHRDY